MTNTSQHPECLAMLAGVSTYLDGKLATAECAAETASSVPMTASD